MACSGGGRIIYQLQVKVQLLEERKKMGKK